jgi:hypothetical protein
MKVKPIRILDQSEKELRNKNIPMMKVLLEKFSSQGRNLRKR